MSISRRSLAFSLASAAFTPLTGRPFRGSSTPETGAPTKPGAGLKLGLDAYSVRSLRWSPAQLVDYAAGLNLDALQLSVQPLADAGNSETVALKERAARAGIALDAATGCVCPSSKSWNPKNGTPEEYLRTGLRAAKALGCTLLRGFMGSDADRTAETPIEAHIENTLKVLRNIRSEAVDLGMRIAIENHKDMTARELRSLVEAAGKEWVGACLDTGNPVAIGEDPALTIEVLGPYAFTSHFRDSAVWECPEGAQFQWVALGDGCVDVAGLVSLYGRTCPQVPVQLEIITGRPPAPVPYLREEFWKLYPYVPAADFARYAALAKRGRPFAGPMLTAASGNKPAEYEAALRVQERIDLERSVKYARDVLGLGLRGRA